MTDQTQNADEAASVITDTNLFRALDLPNAEERHTKTKLALRFSEVIEDSGLSVTALSNHTGLSVAEINDIVRGKTGSFTIDRLLKALTALNQNVEIRVSPSREASGHLSAHVFAGV